MPHPPCAVQGRSRGRPPALLTYNCTDGKDIVVAREYVRVHITYELYRYWLRRVDGRLLRIMPVAALQARRLDKQQHCRAPAPWPLTCKAGLPLQRRLRVCRWLPVEPFQIGHLSSWLPGLAARLQLARTCDVNHRQSCPRLGTANAVLDNAPWRSPVCLPTGRNTCMQGKPTAAGTPPSPLNVRCWWQALRMARHSKEHRQHASWTKLDQHATTG